MFKGYKKKQALITGGDTTNPARNDNLYISIALNETPSSINFSPKKKVIVIQVQQIMDIVRCI